MKIGILGAGAAGLSAAYFLRDSDHDVSLNEASGEVGGLARSFRWHGFNCDLAPHRLHAPDPAIVAEIDRLAPLNRLRRRSRIYVSGQWLCDPLSPLELLLKLPPSRACQIVRSYLSRPRLAEDSFASLALNRFGDGLFQLFFKPYSEKLFGVEADQIAASWGRRKLRLGSPLRQWRRESRLHFHYFYYPKRGGYGAICGGLLESLRCSVRLHSRLVHIRPVDDRGFVCTFDDQGEQRTEQFDLVISSLPVTYLASLMGLTATLRFHPMRLVYLLLARPRLGRDQWFYFADRDKIVNRVAEFKNFTDEGTPRDRTVVCCEVTELEAFSLQRVLSDLRFACGLRQDEVRDTKIIDLERAYPIYDRSYEKQLEDVERFFAGYPRILHLGRSAQFAHQDVDEIFTHAKQAVTAILHHR
jgi:protoporphyrinogen oxidase